VETKYRWKRGRSFPVSAETFAECMQQLRETSEDGQTVTATQVVESARSRNSPMHACFEWKNNVAARKYRNEQARRMIRSIRVIQIDDNGKGKPRIAFVSVYSANESPAGYWQTEVALSDVDKRSIVLNAAWSALRSWHERYGHLVEFKDVVVAILKREAAEAEEARAAKVKRRRRPKDGRQPEENVNP
jgi:hypothetical protein